MNEKTVTLLNDIAENAEMGKSSVEKLLTIVEDASLRHHLHKQLATYDDLLKRAHAMVSVEGAMPKEQSGLTKTWAQMGITMQTIGDRSPRKIAEMLIEGSTVGVTDMTKALKDADGANPGAVALAQRLQNAEQQYADELTSFL